MIHQQVPWSTQREKKDRTVTTSQLPARINNEEKKRKREKEMQLNMLRGGAAKKPILKGGRVNCHSPQPHHGKEKEVFRLTREKCTGKVKIQKETCVREEKAPPRLTT